jgi:exosortase/archaeosortase family protein
MKQFMTRYLFFLAISFTFLYLNNTPFSYEINHNQTAITLYFLEYFLNVDQLKGVDIWINPYYKIIINDACNGIVPILFFISGVLAYPLSLKHTMIWIFFGYIIFTSVNIFRIILVTYITQKGEGQKEFFWAHDIVGNILLITVGMVLFLLYIRTAKDSE